MTAHGVGVVGLGFGARVHVPAFRRVEGFEVRAVCARNGAEQTARELGVPQAYADWRDLLADDGVDVVAIASPPATHAEIASAALDAGKAVYCEKPLAATAAAADALAEQARGAAAQSIVGFEFRAVSAFVAAHDLLAGLDVHFASVHWTLGTRASGPLPPSWKDDPAQGGGALLSLGVHSFDYVEWLLGRVARVRGTVAETAGASDTGFEAELELASGAVVSLLVDTAAPEPAGHVLQFETDQGLVLLENREFGDFMRSFRLEGAGARVEPEPTSEDGRIAPVAALAARLLSEDRPEPSLAAGARAQRLAEALASSNGAWMQV